MRRIGRKTAWRTAGVLVALILLQASALVSRIDASRDSADCVQHCNALRDLCKGECAGDCAILYPPGQDRNSCESLCDAICNDESQDCKARCNVNKLPPSTPEP